MHLELGFVSICLTEQKCSPAGSVTVKQVADLDPEARRNKILRVARRNLENTLRIMWFLRAHDIRLYRISAMLIPLATHEFTDGWAWWEEDSLREIGQKIGNVSRENRYRLSSHLPEFCGFTGDKTFRWAEEYLLYHERLFDLLGLGPDAKIILHVGGSYGEKKRAKDVARANLDRLSPWARERVVLENDDRTYTVADVLQLAEVADVPVAFDWHHHWCHHGDRWDEASSVDQLRRAFRLWKDRPPKVHVSSPRSASQVRAHADYVDADFLEPFLELMSKVDSDTVDVMVEAKKKDLALFKLRAAPGHEETSD